MLPIQHVDQLLELHGPAFLSAVYQTLLGRLPDPKGSQYYLGRLRAGYSRASIIARISKSKEAKSRVVETPLGGIDRLVAEERRASHWLLKFFFRPSRMERKINQLEYQLGGIASLLAKLPAGCQMESTEDLTPLKYESLPTGAQQVLARLSQARSRLVETGRI